MGSFCVINQVELLKGRFFGFSKLPQDCIGCHSFSPLKKRRRNYSLNSVLFGVELVEKVFVHSLSLGWVQHVEGDSERGTDYFGFWKKLLKTVRTIYYDVNDQNFVDDWSPVFRGVTIKEIGLHPSGVLRILNKPENILHWYQTKLSKWCPQGTQQTCPITLFSITTTPKSKWVNLSDQHHHIARMMA